MKLALAILLVLVFALPLAAQTVSFAWDPHPEATTITGFKLYQSKTSLTYIQPAVATFTGGALTTGSIPTPTAFGRYYFVLTAFYNDTTTNPPEVIESTNSNEVSLVVKPKQPKLVSAIQSAAMAPVKAMTYVAGLLKPDKGLRIK